MTLVSKVLAGMVAVLLVMTGVLTVRLRHQTAWANDGWLRADSVAAANDTLRVVAATDKRTMWLLGDSLQAVTTKIQQGKLEQHVVSTAAVTATVKPGLFEVTPVPFEGDTLKRFFFQQRRTPFSLSLFGAYQPARDTIDIKAEVLLDPVTLRVDLMCRPKPVNGVRQADAVVMGPLWLNITGVKVSQQGGVCNGDQAEKGAPWYVPEIVAGLGWSWQEDHSGPAGFVGVGYHLSLFGR